MHDVIVVGGGPAGLTAALFAKRQGLDVIVLNNPEHPSNLSFATIIENWPGIEKTSGQYLLDEMKKQVSKLKVPIKNERAIKISKENGFEVKTPDNIYKSKTVILSTGMKNRKAGIKGEDDLLGRGVSYCTTCDAPLFMDKTVAVIGGGNSAVHGAVVLKGIAKKVYLVHRRDEFRAEKAMTDKLSGIEMLLNSIPEEIKGKNKVERIVIKNLKTNKTREIDVDGVFIEIGYVPTNELVKDIGLSVDKAGFIITDIDKKTNIHGIFAAGDVSTNPLKQITTAVSDGSVAAISAYKFIKGG